MSNNIIIIVSILSLLIILFFYFDVTSLFRRNIEYNKWSSVSMSRNGQKIVVASLGSKILLSADGGNTWNKKYKISSWSDVAISGDGNIILVADLKGYVALSKDGGNTWIDKLTDIRRRWTGVAMSDDGKYQIACIGGGEVYISNDSGETWDIIKDTLIANESRSWSDVYTSDSGQYITLVATSKERTVGGEYIYVSNNFGISWTQQSIKGNWNSIAISGDGKYQTALSMGSKIYMSEDFGQTWNIRSEVDSLLWYNVKMSKDGEYQTAVAYNDGIYTFKDENYDGIKDNVKEWLLRTSIIRNWCALAMSEDGKKQIAFIFDSNIYYVSEDYGNTWKSRKI